MLWDLRNFIAELRWSTSSTLCWTPSWTGTAPGGTWDTGGISLTEVTWGRMWVRAGAWETESNVPCFLARLSWAATQTLLQHVRRISGGEWRARPSRTRSVWSGQLPVLPGRGQRPAWHRHLRLRQRAGGEGEITGKSLQVCGCCDLVWEFVRERGRMLWARHLWSAILTISFLVVLYTGEPVRAA